MRWHGWELGGVDRLLSITASGTDILDLAESGLCFSSSLKKSAFAQPFFLFPFPQAPSSPMPRFFAHTQTAVPQLVTTWQMRNSE